MMRETILVGLLGICMAMGFGGCKRQEPAEEGGGPSGEQQEETGEPAAQQEAPGEGGQAAARVAREAPGFTLVDQNGQQVSLSDYEGKVVVLEWINYDCPFVQRHYEADLRTMAGLLETYRPKGVVWLSINSTFYANPEKNKQWAEQQNIDWPVLDDHTGQVGRLYGATNTPHMFVVDKSGRIVYEGAIDNNPAGDKDKEDVVNYVDEALSGVVARQVVSTRQTRPYGCTVKYAQ